MTAHDVEATIPELREGYAQVLAWADFCHYLSDGDVGTEARELARAARALLAATRRGLPSLEEERTYSEHLLV